VGLKLFTGVSLFLMIFYLSGINMSVQKLAFHCLRYISPSFIILNLAVVVVIKEVLSVLRRGMKRRSSIMANMGFVSKNVAAKHNNGSDQSKTVSHSLRYWQWVWLFMDATPLIVPTAVAIFGVVAILFLLVGQFNPWYIWSFGLLGTIAATFIIVKNYPREVTHNSARQACNILVVTGVVLWGGFNVLFTSQHLLVNRDPAIYANAGIWLVKHENLKMDLASKQPPEMIGSMFLPKEHIYSQLS
jgi:hypothetical protein